MSRLDELTAGLEQVRARIDAACQAAGRSVGDVRLVTVSKTWPVSDIALLQTLGVRDFGENRDHEAATKARELAADPPRWHFVGSVQSSKAMSVASYADVVHSLDRRSLLTALDRGAVAAGRTVEVLLQVSLDGDPARGGAVPSALAALADAAAEAPGLRLAGLMAVAPLGVEPDRAFAELALLAADLRTRHPGAGAISAGMSGDLEAAVAHGATLLRVGTAVLGHRPSPLR